MIFDCISVPDDLTASLFFSRCFWCRYCGVHNPSWSELTHFVSFLNKQLRDFEFSVYCSMAAEEDLPQFSTFVLRFVVQMSRVNFMSCKIRNFAAYCTHSITESRLFFVFSPSIHVWNRKQTTACTVSNIWLVPFSFGPSLPCHKKKQKNCCYMMC